MAPSRREFLAGMGAAPKPAPITVGVQILFDRGAHGGKGLREAEIALFRQHQATAAREYAVSSILFEVHFLEGAFLRTQGYSQIPDKFLARKVINLFVTDSLGYDIDRDRTGGCSMGPRQAGDPFFKIFLGLKDAREHTLTHEYSHHFTLDTQRNPSAHANFWADLRNDYWLWRQRHGVPIGEFRACRDAEWARWG